MASSERPDDITESHVDRLPSPSEEAAAEDMQRLGADVRGEGEITPDALS